jgi:CubicO group peptidase (beta-lactamase class C family)
MVLRRVARKVLPARVRTSPPEEVTTVGQEADPREANLRNAEVDAIWRSVVRLYRTGLHPAIGLHLRRGGVTVLDRTIGHSHGNSPDDDPTGPKILATPQTRFSLMSGSKAITAMVVHLLDERGLLHLDDPVAHYIPEFGRHGKQAITVRHLLLHRAGIPAIPGADLDLDVLVDPKAALEVIYDAKLLSRPGATLAYHAITGGFILAEVVRRVSGRDIRQFLDEEIRAPLGFASLSYGVPPSQAADVAMEAFTGVAPRFGTSRFLERSLGVDVKTAVDISNDVRFRTGIVPSGNVIATPSDACRFMELMLRGGELDGVRVFDERTVRRATSEQTWLELDRVIMLPIRYSMGFMLGGQRLSFYGPGTPEAFGHLGFTNVLIWADPERDLSCAFLNTGKPFLTPEMLMWFDVMRTIANRVPRTPVR